MRHAVVMGNWKMNPRLNEAQTLLDSLYTSIPQELQEHCVIFPPSVYLPMVKQYFKNSAIRWGAQNVYPKDSGAFTGEISTSMLADFDCGYVLVGHSERRNLFQESEKFVAEKFHHVKLHGMIPVLCVGETLKEREQGRTEEVLCQQLASVANYGNDCMLNCIIAYEPVWAIGTGATATPNQAQETHAFIRSLLKKFSPKYAATLPIIYGGSVNEKNASALFAMPDVDGGLVGGASLNAQQFVDILKCIKSY